MSKKNLRDYFKIDPKLKIREELVSIHALQPFIAHNSSPRGYMFSSHLSQSLTINNSEEKIIQSGLEQQLSYNTFAIVIPCDAKIIKVLKRYNSLDYRSLNRLVDYVVIFQNLETEEYDVRIVPSFHYIQPPVGFTYIRNTELLEKLQPGDLVQKNTVLADSPGASPNNGYKYGINAAMCMASLPETSEDGVVISESFAKKMNYDYYEHRIIEFGSDSFPLNLYGDKDNFKPFPEIGEIVHSDGVLMAIRKYEPGITAATCSYRDIQEYNPIFDKVCYVKSPSSKDPTVKSGEIVDIKLYTSARWDKDLFTNMDTGIEKHKQGLIKFHREILTVYDYIKEEYRKLTDTDRPKLSEELQQLLIESMSVGEITKAKPAFTYKNEKINNIRIEFVIAYRNNVLNRGNKITGNSGDKGVIVDIKPDHLMPYTIINGEKVVAEIIMDPASVISRMNIGRAYEHYFNAASRRTQYLIRQAMNYKPDKPISAYTNKEIDKGWDILVNFTKILETEQYTGYAELGNIQEKLEILYECLTKEVYIYYKVSSPKPAYVIVADIEASIYKPEINPVHMPLPDGKEVITKTPIMIAPLYIMLLAQTAEKYSSISSAKVNHFGLPIVISSATKHDLPYRTSPTKILSETETRLYTSYVSRKAIAELKDRANSIPAHREIYRTILNADKPTDIDHVIDRTKTAYGQDVVMEVVNSVFNCAGVEIDYFKDGDDE